MSGTQKAPEIRVVRRGGVRLDRAVADMFDCGRRRARGLISAGLVRVDGHLARPSMVVPSGATVSLERTAPAERPNPLALQAPAIVAETDTLLAIAKPAGMHSHAGRGAGSVAEWLRSQRPTLAGVGGGEHECGLVHRLDRDTSGILLAAKDERTYLSLRAAFSRHRVTKYYLALVSGEIDAPFVLDSPLARRRTRVVAARRGDKALSAQTQVEPLAVYAGSSLVKARMRTGVTHQIRAHLAQSGHPIVGDAKYGGPPAPPHTRSGHLLHALEIELPSGESLRCPPPEDFEAARELLERGE